ncbi:pseudouridine synthase [Marinobacter halodurans]|uniref:Pseudouridine synthase n=1 Tax=Marinobacter halodurans TaxID=2528979 RepID=A0ABY1ZQP5_9GAMM|nr:pseudouridine synthase [Marinobacter halodurans]TBW59135.1 pseudouridine synthase [Marinobacter halodurans]
MATLILLNKPFNVLCQFTDNEGRSTLADFVGQSSVYPAGRLDYDSEGLVLLTDDGQLQHRIASPRQKMPKTYWVQVDGEIDDAALERLEKGVDLKDGPTRPATARHLGEPEIWPRHPPVRYRANVPTSWIELTITEGRNRQVRRMTAAVGFPTLRLIRRAVGDWSIDNLAPGESRSLSIHLPAAAAKTSRGQGRPRAKKRNR